MSNLTKQQLEALHSAVIERLREFDLPDTLLPTAGVVRLVVDVYAEADWDAPVSDEERDDTPPAVQFAETWPMPAPISEHAAAALGPEHTVVTPIKNGNGTHKITREERIAQELGDDTPLPANRHLPNKPELLAEIKRISMAGMMPTQAAFDAARPAVWSTAQAHLTRLGISWSELADEAGLTIRRGPSGTEKNP